MAKVDYAHITDDIKQRIVSAYREARSFNCPPDQSVAIAGYRGFQLTKAQQRSPIASSNAFAAACAVLVMAKVIDLRHPVEGVIE